MSTDLVAQLRQMEAAGYAGWSLARDAADEIERLHAALKAIADREPQAREAVAKGWHNTTFAIDLAGMARSALDVPAPQCRHTATNGTTMVRVDDKITCSVCKKQVHDFTQPVSEVGEP